MAKLFILAGEPSGDLHGSYLVKQLLSQRSDLIIKGWGGDKMKSAGAEILRSLDHLAFMGFTEVAKNISTVLTNFRLCKKQISSFQPDVIVFIDYPGFNLRMAKWAKAKGYKTIQYIAPAVWAWKENRVETIKKYIDKLLVILPFEESYFAKHNITARFVGHPLIEQLNDRKPTIKLDLPALTNGNKNIALLPGSRLQEIKNILPKMVSYAKTEKDYNFYIVVPQHLDLNIYKNYLLNLKNIHLVKGSTYELLFSMDAAIVSSGTATLEVALMNVPQVVCYHTGVISFTIAKQLVKTKHISLVNLIAKKEVVKELIQNEFNTESLKLEIANLLNTSYVKNIQFEYENIKKKLTEESASQNSAKIILSYLR